MSAPDVPAAATRTERLRASGAAVGRAVGFAPSLSSSRAGWNSLALFAWRGPCDEADFEPLSEPAIVYHTAGAASVPVRVGRNWNQLSRPGLVTIIPPATPITWNVRGEVHSFSVHLASRFLASPMEDERLDPAQHLRFECGMADPLLSASIAALARELGQPAQRGPLYADSVADVMALHLLRHAAAPLRTPATAGGLSRNALRRVLDLLECSIEHGVSLQALAAQAALSRGYFAEAFRRSTGITAHRYLTQRRVARAQTLLRDTDLAVAEIALRCGFSSQAHFSGHFRRLVGIPPGRFRAVR